MGSRTEVDDDELRLARMGYRQEFTRTWSLIHNFGASFSAISILVGVGTLLSYALVAGGSGGAVWGWIFVAIMSCCVALAMAEICSAYPTAGGLYYWSAKLGGDKHGPMFAWYTAWFNFCGGIGGMPAGGFALSTMLFSVVLAYNPEFDLQNWKITIVGIAIVISWGIWNSFNDAIIARVMELSVFLHLVGPVVMVASLLAKAPTRQSATFVFTDLQNFTGQDSQGFAILLGLLFPAWTFIGYDASAHMSEETKRSHVQASRGIVWSVVISAFWGLFLLLGLMFAIQDIESILTSTYPQLIMQLFVDAAGPDIATLCMMIMFVGSYCGGVAIVAANSRMSYAFARDKGFGPIVSPFLYWSHPVTKIPLRTIWFGVSIAVALTCIGFGSVVGLLASSSVATIGQTTAYVIPTFTKLLFARDTFKRGEFHLGALSEIIGWIAVIWVLFLSVLLCLPQAYPVTAQNFNYAVVMIGAVVFFATVYWVVEAHKWFKGPVIRISEEELAQLEELAHVKSSAVGVSEV